MKGFTHFMSGLAAVTFFPEAVQMAYQDKSFILVLGGIFGILPDTLDFKFAQFFEKYHTVIDPDPHEPNAQEIANQVAATINAAHQSGKPRSLHLLTIQKSSDLWRQYKLFFDTDKHQVQVALGPIVNTSKKPFPGTELTANTTATVPIEGRFAPKLYDRETSVDILSGPSFEFVPQQDGTIQVEFLSWHRRWSHSLVLGAFLGLLGWLIFRRPIYGWVIAVGFWVHILEDQLGYMGNNLFWPFTRHKIRGTASMHSGDVWPNFGTVWLAVTLILYNINRFAPEPVFTTNFLVFVFYACVLPLGIIYGLGKLLGLYEMQDDRKNASATEQRQSEAMSEQDEEAM